MIQRRRIIFRVSSSRRAVSSVLSMMFLVLFGSLAAAMAVVAHGNLRTADSALKVSRSMSAAETGLVFATQRLQSEAARFVITKGSVEGQLVDLLWMAAPCSGDCGSVQYIEDNGQLTNVSGFGIAHVVLDRFAADGHSITPEPGDAALPTLDGISGTLTVRPVALSTTDDGSPNPDGPYFRLKFEMLDPADYEEHGHVRITSQGVFGGVRRTLQTDVRIAKKIEYAILSPNRIMIGKNVMIEGPIGSVYGTEVGELEAPNSHPLRMLSDFYHLSPGLDNSLNQFYNLVAQHDVDGDNQLRPGHPVEGPPSSGFGDFTGDGYVSDFDLFLAEFGGANPFVVYDAALAGQSANFTIDPELSRLIDLYLPDRDGDGMVTSNDNALGYEDGVLDWLDDYAKVHGRLAFAITRGEWESRNPAINNYRQVVQGPIKPRNQEAPVAFGVDSQDLLHVTTDMFDSSHSWFEGKAQGDFFTQASGSGDIICPDWDDPPGWEGICTDTATTDELWEPVPFDAAMPYDYYERPVFRNITFTNVRIPMGLNALFEDCTFIGATYIETTSDNEDDNWNHSGTVGPPNFEPVFGEDFDGNNFNEVEHDGNTYEDTKPLSNNIRFHNCTFLGSISGDTPLGYAHWRNKVQMTGETRFYIDPNDSDLLEEDDAATLQSILSSIPASDREELAKSSILMPGWSMDVGAFTTDPNADPDDLPIIKLRGTIVAGILDIRGRADVHGTLLMTFRPALGVLPLTHVPNNCWSCMSAFSTTIGYLGPDFGDFEGFDPTDPNFEGFGEIRLRYNPDTKLPDGIPWPVRIEAVPNTYFEGGSL